MQSSFACSGRERRQMSTLGGLFLLPHKGAGFFSLPCSRTCNSHIVSVCCERVWSREAEELLHPRWKRGTLLGSIIFSESFSPSIGRSGSGGWGRKRTHCQAHHISPTNADDGCGDRCHSQIHITPWDCVLYLFFGSGLRGEVCMAWYEFDLFQMDGSIFALAFGSLHKQIWDNV